MTVTTQHRPPAPAPAPAADADAAADPDAIETALRPVYRERAELVAELAARWPAVLVNPAPDLPAYAIVHIHTAAGSITRHIHRDDLDLLAHVRRVGPGHPLAQWDGHTSAEGYARLRALRTAPSDAPRPIIGARTVWRDGRGDLWITSDTAPDRIRSLTPEHAPPRYGTPAGVAHDTGSLVALGGAR
ncbi:hypothetical protein [Embleya sp. NPDC020886]|uniref:hypothetical protein n=1 Tax=Embleya sp. NPDC020886 TaxID=3363980 RepID=UPI0037B6317C